MLASPPLRGKDNKPHYESETYYSLIPVFLLRNKQKGKLISLKVIPIASHLVLIKMPTNIITSQLSSLSFIILSPSKLKTDLPLS